MEISIKMQNYSDCSVKNCHNVNDDCVQYTIEMMCVCIVDSLVENGQGAVSNAE